MEEKYELSEANTVATLMNANVHLRKDHSLSKPVYITKLAMCFF